MRKILWVEKLESVIPLRRIFFEINDEIFFLETPNMDMDQKLLLDRWYGSGNGITQTINKEGSVVQPSHIANTTFHSTSYREYCRASIVKYNRIKKLETLGL